MKELKIQEQLNVKGGAISGAIWNAINDSIGLVLDLGRNLGSAIRRLFSGKMCGF